MKFKNSLKKLPALILCVAMLAGLLPLGLFAAYNRDFESETHDVFKSTPSQLAPGVEQYINYAYASDGKQMVYYVATADITRDDVFVQTSYLKQHENGTMGMDKLTAQIAYANKKYSNPDDSNFISEYYNVVAGVNASFYNMQTGQPIGITYIDGVSFGTVSYDNFFAILKDGKTAVIDYAKNIGNYVDENGNSTIWQAAAGSQWLVRDGKDVTAGVSGSYNTDRHSRTCVGITAEGKVVMMVLDGRQEPFSCGGSMHELAQIMLEAGCVAAINLDGGGSTTFASRPEGSDEVKVINRPSDGSERSISSGLIIASTAVPSNSFDHVTMGAEEEYITPGTSVNVTVAGVSPAGTSAAIPDDISYVTTNGTFENGVLTATAAGDVIVTAMYDGKEVGSLTVHCVIPQSIAFNSAKMTVPFGKTVALSLTATYGLNTVKFKASDIAFTLSDNTVGTVNGLTFTAADSGTSSTITAKFIGTDVTAVSQISLGKGSEVIFDFEDGNVSDFVLSYEPYNYTLPEGRVYHVTSATGKVHSGNGAMALDINYGNSLESGYMMTALLYNGDEKTFENATRLGMWIYISDEDVSTWIRYTVFPLVKNDAGEYVKGDSLITNTLADGVASTTGFVNQYSEPGWHYLSIDLNAYAGLYLHQGYIVQFYISDRDGASYGYYYNQHKSYNGRYVMYVDDITVDYSDAVDDREAPVFGDVTYATPSMSDAASLNGQTVSDNTLSFGVKVADNTSKTNFTGINAATAKVYIDGVEFPCTFKDGVMSVSDVVLADGLHHVKFSVCDNQGNYASVIRTVNVNAGSGKSTVKVVAHDPSSDKIKLGSVWYVDVVATDIEKVQSVTVDIDLNNMSRWELAHLTTAKGFTASYSIQDDENIATITITRTGENDSTGEAVLASLPIRTWELKTGYTYTSGTKKGSEAFTYAQFKNMNEFWPVDISMEIDRGIVVFTDGTTDTFSGEGPQVDTEMYKMAKDMISTAEGKAYFNAWDGGHIHSAHAVEDKSATCTESGYTGRTFCDVCNSVVDWGTTLEAKGHSYAITDGILRCGECGDIFSGLWTDGKTYVDGVAVSDGWVNDSYYLNGKKLTGIQKAEGFYYDFGTDGVCAGRIKYTGLIEIDGKYSYSQIGVLSEGWKQIDDAWYYFDPQTKTNVESFNNGRVTFTFESNGKLVSGMWYHNATGYRYYYGPDYYRASFAGYAAWKVIDGKTYNFDTAGYRTEGTAALYESAGKAPGIYEFTADGVLIGKTTATGVVTMSNGDIYYVNDGMAVYAGLVKDADGRYLYISGNDFRAVKNCTKHITYTNRLLPAGTYTFGADGRMVMKQGIVRDADGEVRYYVDDVPTYAGLVKDTDGNYYYISGATLTAVKNCTKHITYTNRLLPAGTYTFGADGRMVMKQGIVRDADGEVRYYVDDVPTYAGLVKDTDGNYYYISGATLTAVKNCTKHITYTNRLLPAGTYTFGADGRMVMKQGIVRDADGEVRYYVDDVPTYAGLVKDTDGNYYYISGATLTAVKNCSKYITYTNRLLPAGTYTFGADGKMVMKQGIVRDADGEIRYYVDDVPTYAGLVKDTDGNYYYISGATLTAVKNCTKHITYTNRLLPAGTYTFGADGKLILE